MDEKLTLKLTGKKFGAIGPPGIPSFGGSWPIGLGAGPAFYLNERFESTNCAFPFLSSFHSVKI